MVAMKGNVIRKLLKMCVPVTTRLETKLKLLAFYYRDNTYGFQGFCETMTRMSVGLPLLQGLFNCGQFEITASTFICACKLT